MSYSPRILETALASLLVGGDFVATTISILHVELCGKVVGGTHAGILSVMTTCSSGLSMAGQLETPHYTHITQLLACLNTKNVSDYCYYRKARQSHDRYTSLLLT
jgi:hypothetical protein